MSTIGWKKPACKRGHVNPPRNAHGACIPCAVDYRRETYMRERDRRIQQAIERAKADPVARSDQQCAHRHGVPVRVIRELIARCGDKCESCSKPLTRKQMCIDHDHATGQLRGVLCRFCNALEGMLNKQADRVELLMVYLGRVTIKRLEREPE